MQRRMPACPDTDKGPTKKVQQGVMMAGNLSPLNTYQDLTTVTTCPIISHQSGNSYMQSAKGLQQHVVQRKAHRDCTKNIIQTQHYKLRTYYPKQDKKIGITFRSSCWQYECILSLLRQNFNSRLRSNNL